jgi:hypothetical protein
MPLGIIIHMIYHIKLQKGETWRPALKAGATYKVLSGTAWVTYKGITKDFLFGAGENFLTSNNETVVEALDELTLELVPKALGLDEASRVNHSSFL